MDRTEVIRMARDVWGSPDQYYSPTDDEIERFASLVAAAERERCCLAIYDETDNMHEERDHVMKEMCCDAIRALT